MSRRRFRFAGIAFASLVVSAVLLALIMQPERFPKEPIKIPASKFLPQIQTSYDAAFLIAPDRSLWVWGQNPWFLRKPAATPQQVGKDKDWKQIAHCFTLALALKADGSLWSWSYFGADGSHYPWSATSSNSTTTAFEPKQVGTEEDWAQICAGGSHALALKLDGSLWAWGQNERGQLGDGTRKARTEPVMISRDGKWKQLTASLFTSYALKSDGTIWAWGVGISSPEKTNDALLARQIGDGSNWVSMAAGEFHLVAQRADGTLWVFGRYADVVAPDFAKGPATNFVQLGGDTNWAAFYCGKNNFVARKTDGSWWGCGENTAGELALRDRWVSKPTALPLTFNAWALDVGRRRTLLLMGDGSLWIWGKPLDPGFPGLGVKVKLAMNKLAGKSGLPRPFNEPWPPLHDPVKIWSVPNSRVGFNGDWRF